MGIRSFDGKRYYLFDYLAVAEQCRNRGIGAEFLHLLSEQFPDADCMIGEIEDPDSAATEEESVLRKRRLEFFQRQGYLLTSVKSQLEGVTFCLLEIPTGPPHSSKQIRNIYEAVYKTIAPDWFIKEHFNIM